MIKEVTPLILTYNEAPNINRTLQRLSWAEKIIVVDSYSNDDTLEILHSYPQVQVFQRKFDTHAIQWNYGLEQVKSEWVLSLDADYTVTDELIAEIEGLPEKPQVNGYFARFKYCVFGKPLRSTILPPRLVLFRKDKAIYIDDGHTQLLQLSGESGMLSGYIYHDDRKHISRGFSSEIKYSGLETKKLLETPLEQLSFVERIRYTKIFAPFLVFLYCLIYKGGILDGWRGWYYALQRTLAELMLALSLIHEDFTNKQLNSLKKGEQND